MGYTLEQLATEIRKALKAQPGPEGRKQVCAIVQNVLKDTAFVTRHVADDVPDRKILYEDPSWGSASSPTTTRARRRATRTTTRTPGRSTARPSARPR